MQRIIKKRICQAFVDKNFLHIKKPKKEQSLMCPAGGIPSATNHFTGNDLLQRVRDHRSANRAQRGNILEPRHGRWDARLMESIIPFSHAHWNLGCGHFYLDFLGITFGKGVISREGKRAKSRNYQDFGRSPEGKCRELRRRVGGCGLSERHPLPAWRLRSSGLKG